MQRLGCNNSSNSNTEHNNTTTQSNKVESATPEIKISKDITTAQVQSKTDSKAEKNTIKNSENEYKAATNIDKTHRANEWDMFADQDNFDSVDVSYIQLIEYFYFYCSQIFYMLGIFLALSCYKTFDGLYDLMIFFLINGKFKLSFQIHFQISVN